MNRWSWEWNQQGDKAEIAVCRGRKQETSVSGLQGEDEGWGTAKTRAETKAVLRLQGRAEVSTVNYGKKDPCLQMLGPDTRVRSGVCMGSSSEPGRRWVSLQIPLVVCVWDHVLASPGFITWGGPYVPDRMLLPYTQLLLWGRFINGCAARAPGK